MDQRKIGSFLKELRKEKNITQEELAEKMNVSNRTVSRWETGANMPDIGLLVELAEFYDVSIPEIINGERKSEKMDKETKETILQVAQYGDTREKNLIKKIILIVSIGCIAWGISLITILSFLKNVSGGVLVLWCSIICLLLYSIIAITIKSNRTATGYINCLIGAFASIMTSNIALLICFFRTGEYYNYGIKGVYMCVLIYIVVFLISMICVTICNKRTLRINQNED